MRHTTWSDLAKQIQTYHEAWREAGHPGTGKVFVSAPTYIAETEERARAEEVMIYAIGLESDFFDGVRMVRSKPDSSLRKFDDETGGGSRT